MTTHAPFSTVRRSAAGLLAALLAGFATTAIAGDGENVVFYLQPVDSTVVAGHQAGFYVVTGCNPVFAEYQWYRNDVAIPEATKQFYRFTAQSADHGARYHVVVKGYRDKIAGVEPPPPLAGPTPSMAATLTVLAAGSNLTPTITAPDDVILTYQVSDDGVLPMETNFRATGNGLEWTYRFDTEDIGLWHALPSTALAAQAVRFNRSPPNTQASTLTVRVIDDAGVAATRTWQVARGAINEPQYAQFYAGPFDSTAVAGRQTAFYVYTNIHPVGPPAPSYQWYRNGVAIPGATSNRYTFTAQPGDDGARYHVVASGAGIKGTQPNGVLEPAASPPGTLTVLPAGTSLPPEIVAPEGDTIYSSVTSTLGFGAVGHDLEWAYRYNTDAPDTWHALAAETTGSQYVHIKIEASGRTSITVRVIDDVGVAATRTWTLAGNLRPVVSGVTVSSNPVLWPGPVTLTATASDFDGDALTYRWAVDYGLSVLDGDAVFTPSGNTCSVTFTKFGYYYLTAAALDGKGGASVMLSEKIVVEPTFNTRTDVNDDGVVNALDLGIVKDHFGLVIP